jgi:hypothetical protein
MPDLIDQAYALVNGVVAANTIGPVINGVVGVAATTPAAAAVAAVDLRARLVPPVLVGTQSSSSPDSSRDRSTAS